MSNRHRARPAPCSPPALATAARHRGQARPAGFTLVEMLVALVVLGVIGAALATVLRPALDAYLGARGRDRLLATADHATRRMVRDIVSAVPNSIRAPTSTCFELVPTSTGGRFRMANDTVNAGAAAVDTSSTTTSFDVLSPMATLPGNGDWVVVDNQNPGDVYAGLNRGSVASVSTPAATLGKHRITLSPAMQFPQGYEGGRFAIVPDAQQAVFYVCSGASTTLNGDGDAPGVLVRLKRYGFNASAPSGCPATTGADVLATHVRSCRFLYTENQGATQQSGFVSIQLELTRQHETASLVVGAHVDNVP